MLISFPFGQLQIPDCSVNCSRWACTDVSELPLLYPVMPLGKWRWEMGKIVDTQSLALHRWVLAVSKVEYTASHSMTCLQNIPDSSGGVIIRLSLGWQLPWQFSTHLKEEEGVFKAIREFTEAWIVRVRQNERKNKMVTLTSSLQRHSL